tara:strand:+ start:170 stop:1258 length:1089 start_codon:yes stop_codon:yes gene_type:complete
MHELNSVNNKFKSILLKRDMLPNKMGDDISESWLRCISSGLDPFKDPKQSVISSNELKQIKEENEALRKIIIPEIELLYSQIAGTNFMVAYSDKDGLVLDTIYDKTCLQGDVGKTVIPGSIWAEKICGTNGLGLSVELKKPTIVSGKEHFFIAHEKISCFASPIINHDGKIMGIIDASTDSKSREQHTLALVKLATRSIETKLFVNKFSRELILSFHPRPEYLSTTSVGLLAINGDGVIVGSNNNAKIMLHGLVDLKNQNFNNIFTRSFSSIASDLLNNKILKITDHLGSSVFVVKSQNFGEIKIKENNSSNKTYACKNCKDTKIKREKCILIRSTFLDTKNISVVSRKLGVSRTTIYKHLN